MAIASITSWLLSGKDYTEGVQLYKQYGSNMFLKMELAKGPDIYNSKKLEIELQKINTEIQSEVENESPQTFIKKETAPSAPEPYHEQLLELRSSRKNKYRQVNHLHASLSLITDQDKRKEVAFEILNLWDDISSSWEVEDKFLSTGKFEPIKPDESALPDNPVQLSRMLNNARSNVTKAAKKLKTAESKPNNEKEILEKKLHLQNHIKTREEIEAKLLTYERS